MPSVKRMRRRRSGTLNMLRTAATNFSITNPVAQTSVRDSPHSMPSNLETHTKVCATLRRADNDGGAAGLLDLLARAPGEAVGGDAQGLGNIAVTQHYYVALGLLD